MVGCLSRYFYGPFAVIIFIALWLTYGRKVALKTLPAFFMAGVFYIAYQKYNIVLTGYGTGMPRIPARESLFLLNLVFLKALILQILYAICFLLVFLGFSCGH